MDNKRGGDWKEWSQHVLIEIQRLHEGQTEQGKTLSANTRQLEIHIEGVRLAREQNAILRNEFDLRREEVNARLSPIEDHVKFFSRITKMVAWSVVLPASVYYIIQIVRSFRG